MNVHRTNSSSNQFVIEGMSAEEVRTIFFALREYRDNLHKSLMNATVNNLDVEDFESVAVHCDDYDALGSPRDLEEGLDVMKNFARMSFDSSAEYEDLAFLHETLYKVNTALFAIIDDHSKAERDAINHMLGVM